jgi:peptidoglycan/LPS O-acetylase OafA/YrhL
MDQPARLAYPPGTTIPPLTALRGIGAVWVVFHHLYHETEFFLLKNGYLGVDLFFVLSGFVLAHVYLRDVPSWDLGGYFNFLKARIARIYPLHFFVLTLLALVVFTLPGLAERYQRPDAQWGLDELAASYLLIQCWVYWLPTAWNSPSWSLSAEWAFYLFFPLAALPVARLRRASVCLWLAAAVACVLIAAFMLKGLPNLKAQGYPGVARAIFEATVGVLCYRAYQLGVPFNVRLWEWVALAVAAIAISSWSLGYLGTFGLAGVILCSACPGSRLGKLLSGRTLVFLGEISYAIYLIHWPIIQVYNWADERYALPGWADTVFRIVLPVAVICLATLCYLFVEKPARRWVRGLATGEQVRRQGAG